MGPTRKLPILAVICLISCGGPRETQTDAATGEIKRLITKYAAAVDAADTNLAGEVWSNSPDVSFIHPLGHEHGWEGVKHFYENYMGAPFSQRKLTVRDVTVHVFGDSAWAEFYWNFVAKLRSNGPTIETNGRETQIYRKAGPGRWVLVHVHYSAMPARRTF